MFSIIKNIHEYTPATMGMVSPRSRGILKKSDFEKLHITGVQENSIALMCILHSSRKNFKLHQNYIKLYFWELKNYVYFFRVFKN